MHVPTVMLTLTLLILAADLIIWRLRGPRKYKKKEIDWGATETY